MDAEYWRKRWREGQTGWHQAQVAPTLVRHWPARAHGAEVLVPFCGKTQDMLWLAEQGYRVLGVDVSKLAIEQFFADNHIAVEQRVHNGDTHYCSEAITLIHADILTLAPQRLAQCTGVYDRGAIVAQPEAERRAYAAHVYGALPDGCQGLLVTVEYPQHEMAGPPFSVMREELEHHLPHWRLTPAMHQDQLDAPMATQHRLSAFATTAYQLEKHVGTD